jgi:hypothetical protein
MLGLLGLGGVAILLVLTAVDNGYLIYYAILCFLIAVPLTLIALILAIVRTIRNRQWRWLVAIVLGTAVFPIVPLLIGAYAWISAGVEREIAASPSAS